MRGGRTGRSAVFFFCSPRCCKDILGSRIGLSISSLALIGLLTLLGFIVHDVATGGSAGVEVSTLQNPQRAEPGVYITTATKYYDILLHFPVRHSHR